MRILSACSSTSASSKISVPAHSHIKDQCTCTQSHQRSVYLHTVTSKISVPAHSHIKDQCTCTQSHQRSVYLHTVTSKISVPAHSHIKDQCTCTQSHPQHSLHHHHVTLHHHHVTLHHHHVILHHHHVTLHHHHVILHHHHVTLHHHHILSLNIEGMLLASLPPEQDGSICLARHSITHRTCTIWLFLLLDDYTCIQHQCLALSTKRP